MKEQSLYSIYSVNRPGEQKVIPDHKKLKYQNLQELSSIPEDFRVNIKREQIIQILIIFRTLLS